MCLLAHCKTAGPQDAGETADLAVNVTTAGERSPARRATLPWQCSGFKRTLMLRPDHSHSMQAAQNDIIAQMPKGDRCKRRRCSERETFHFPSISYCVAVDGEMFFYRMTSDGNIQIEFIPGAFNGTIHVHRLTFFAMRSTSEQVHVIVRGLVHNYNLGGMGQQTIRRCNECCAQIDHVRSEYVCDACSISQVVELAAAALARTAAASE